MEAESKNSLHSGTRFQFTIRDLLALSLLFALGASVPVTGGGSVIQYGQVLVETFVPLGILSGIAIAGRRGVKLGVFPGLAVACFLLWGIKDYSYWMPFSTDTEHLSVLSWLTMLLMTFLIYWNLQRTHRIDSAEAGLRLAARFSISVIVLLVPLLFLRDRVMPEWHWISPPSANRYSDVLELVDWMLIFLMAMSLLPWVVLDRRRAAGPLGRPYSRWDSVAKILLRIDAVLGPVALGAIFIWLLTSHDGSNHFAPDLVLIIGAGFLLLAGSLSTGVLLISGFTIELYRNRWCIPSTLVSFFWLVVYWALAVGWQPFLALITS